MAVPLILVTNDDGVYAPGIRALREAVDSLGRVITVAPERDKSAVSHSLTMNRPLRVREIEPDIYTLDGTPTDCVCIALNKILAQQPDLIVSGINPGPNLGDDISYSGTVSAAIEGTMHGVPSLAFSMAGGEFASDFSVAVDVAWKLASMALQFSLPENTLLNINIPDQPESVLNGIRFARQGRRLYKNSIQEIADPWGRPHYWIGGGTVHCCGGEDTDEQAILDGFVSVTPIQLDLTNHDGIDFLEKNWQM